MAEFQLISAEVNVAGSRDNTVVRGVDDPITYPELLVLRTIHGGIEHVHGEVVIGTVQRDQGEERKRLAELYGGAVIAEAFPGVTAPLPLGDDGIPTLEEANAALAAAEAARSKARAARSKPVARQDAPSAPPADDPEPAEQNPPLVPDLTVKTKK